MKNLLTSAIFTLLSIVVFGQIPESAAIDSVFMEWNQANSPGCAIGIVKDGKLIYGKGYGMANLEYNIPNSTESVFRIASTSKQFTAACIVMLEEQGKLKFDDKLSDFFPEFPDYANTITVLQLLNHSSGIRDYLMISYLAGLGDNDYYTDEDVMKWLINQKDNNFPPNEEYLYSNSGYWLLGQIVHKVSGLKMNEYAKKNLFDPLGMTHTHFHNDHNHIVPNRASGYQPTDDGYKISMTTLDMIGDGGIYTTVEDMKIWDDNYYESTVLSADFWQTMTAPLVLNNGSKEDYAKGIGNGEYKGLKTLAHGGAFVGYRAQMIRFPNQKTSFIVLANRGDANPTAMAHQVADIILKDSFPITKMNASTSSKTKDKVIKLSSNQLEKFSGSYWNNNSNYSRKIYLKNDTLRYFRSENSESSLVPVGKSKFKMLGVTANLTVSFSRNDAEQQVMSVTIDGGNPILSVAYDPVSYTAEELKTFAGKYFSDELDVTYTLKMDGAKLILYVNGEQISPVESIRTNLLSNDDYGLFQFTSSADGSVNAFKLMAGRVKNLRFVRL
jgi:CubicO group peptidase (beta-lactamase class C family)